MKFIILTSMLLTSFYAHTYRIDPALDRHKACLHATADGGLQQYKMMLLEQPCPPFVGHTAGISNSGNSNDGGSCLETHPQDGAALFVCSPETSASSQACWIEEVELSDQ